jgi:DNA-binding MarR family transcriptional regulator
LSWAEYEVLFRLQAAGGRPLLMSEIAARLLASPSTITRIADRLAADQLIDRHTPPINCRVVQVQLTDRGRSALASADKAFLDTLTRTFSAHLSATDVAALRRILRKLLEGNGAWAAARCEPGAGSGNHQRNPRARTGTGS